MFVTYAMNSDFQVNYVTYVIQAGVLTQNQKLNPENYPAARNNQQYVVQSLSLIYVHLFTCMYIMQR